MVSLRVSNLGGGVSRRERGIFEDVTLRLDPGELVALMGPSGCGKTTLLKHCAGIFGRSATASGLMEWHDANGHKLSKTHRHRLVKYVPTQDFVATEQTVRGCLMSQGRLRLSPKSDIEAVVDRLLSSFELTSCQNQRIGDVYQSRISTGQRRRLAFAMECIDNPPALLIDEPTSGLDAHNASSIIQSLCKLVKTENKAVLCVTHQPSARVFQMFDRIYLMAGGRVLFNGTPQEVLGYFSDDLVKEMKLNLPMEKPSPLERVFCVAQHVHNMPKPSAPPEVHFGGKGSHLTSFGVLFMRHTRNRIRNPGFWRSTLLILVVLGLVVGTVYWQAARALDSFDTIPLEPTLPALDLAHPYPPWSTGEEMTSTEEMSSTEKMTSTEIGTSTDYTDEEIILPKGPYTLTDEMLFGIRTILSVIFWGLDGQGSRVVLDPILNGIDGNGSVFEIPQGLLDILPDFIPCVHENYGLGNLYPPTDFEIPDWEGNESLTQEVLKQAMQAYQILDFVFNRDWIGPARCFSQWSLPLTQWSCVLFLRSSEHGFYDVPVTCAGLPSITGLEFRPPAELPRGGSSRTRSLERGKLLETELQEFSDTAIASWFQELIVNGTLEKYGAPTEEEIEDIRFERVMSPTMNRRQPSQWQALTRSATEALSRTNHYLRARRLDSRENGNRRNHSWETVLRILPINLDFSELVAYILWPSMHRPSIKSKTSALAESMLQVFEKSNPNSCILPVCTALQYLPEAFMTILNEILHHTWSVVNLAGFAFVVTAIAGCWGIEAALSFPDARILANKDILNGSYARLTFALARMLVDIAVQTLPMIAFVLIVGYMSGMSVYDNGVGKMLGVLVLETFSAGGMAMFASSLCSSKAASTALATLLLTLCLLTTGFVLRGTVDSVWFQVLGTFSMVREAYAAMMLIVSQGGVGVASEWFVADMIGGVREVDGFTYAGCLARMLYQGLLYRLAALVFLHLFHTRVGLKNS